MRAIVCHQAEYFFDNKFKDEAYLKIYPDSDEIYAALAQLKRFVRDELSKFDAANKDATTAEATMLEACKIKVYTTFICISAECTFL